MEERQFENSPAIRLIGVRETEANYSKEIVCRFWYDEENSSNTAR